MRAVRVVCAERRPLESAAKVVDPNTRIVGDRVGHVGVRSGKAKETPDAMKKAVEQAKKNWWRDPIAGETILHDIVRASDRDFMMFRPVAPTGEL
jgi:ribosomal protein S5